MQRSCAIFEGVQGQSCPWTQQIAVRAAQRRVPSKPYALYALAPINEKALRISETRLSLAAISTCSRPRFTSPSSAPSPIRRNKSLDEASITLGANSFTTLRRVILPLMGPAILAALTYSFVRAITSVSAVIFLVSARHNMATSFIVGRVENNEYGIAIAYATVLIVTMLAAILLLQALIGRRRLRRIDRVAA